jgi:6-phosphofructokinase 1
MVCLYHGHLQALPFNDLRDPQTGRTRVRTVDIHSEHYLSARQYMIRLEPRDLTNPDTLAQLAQTAGMSPAEFNQAFAPAVALTNEEVAAR